MVVACVLITIFQKAYKTVLYHVAYKDVFYCLFSQWFKKESFSSLLSEILLTGNFGGALHAPSAANLQ